MKKVRLIEHLPLVSLTLGKIYTVLEEKEFYYTISNDAGVTGGWLKTRFEVVEKPKPLDLKVGSKYKTSNNFIVTIVALAETILIAKDEMGAEFFQHISNASNLWTEYVKPIEVGSKVYTNISNLVHTVTAIHGNYAWVHTDGSRGGSIQKLNTLKVI